MKLIRVLVPIALAGPAIALPGAAQTNLGEVKRLLAPPTVSVEVLEMWSPPRLQQLSARLSAAAQRDPDWFRAHAASAQPGQPLPYDARLGITEAEYREFFELSAKMTMRPARTAVLEVTPTANGWRFGSGTSLTELRGVEIDTVAGTVRTPFGVLRAAAPIRASSGQAATGPWGGSRWSLESGTPSAGVTATFALGRHVETERFFLYYQAKEVRSGALARRADLVLRGAP